MYNERAGNPVGLVQNLGTGIQDFFYEPFEGLATEGSLEAFLSGLGKGARACACVRVQWRGAVAALHRSLTRSISFLSNFQ